MVAHTRGLASLRPWFGGRPADSAFKVRQVFAASERCADGYFPAQSYLDLVGDFTPAESIGLFSVPTIAYDSSCTCFFAHAVVSTDLMKAPLDAVRGKMMAAVELARQSLKIEFPEFPTDEVPNRDLRMTFFELDLKTPNASHDIAEYANGKITFK